MSQGYGAYTSYNTGSDTVAATVLAVTVMSTTVDRLMRQCHNIDMISAYSTGSYTLAATVLAVTVTSTAVEDC